MVSGNSTVVKQSTHCSKVKGSSLVIVATTGREKMVVLVKFRVGQIFELVDWSYAWIIFPAVARVLIRVLKYTNGAGLSP